MKTKLIIAALMLLLSAGAIAQTVPTTFKTVADGSDTFQQQPIAEPTMTMKQNGQTIFDGWNPPITNYPLNLNTDYIIAADEDRIHLGGKMYKHHDWDNRVSEYHLMHLFNSGGSTDPLVKPANFITPASIQIFNNFEEFADDGMVSFRDPWYVDGNGDQTGDPNDFPSPYIPTGSAKYQDPADAAVFLNQAVTPGRPYYSAEFPTFLDWDRSTTVNPPLVLGDWSLVKVYAREANDAAISFSRDPNVYELSPTWKWQRTATLGVDLKFENPDAQVFAFYKSHMRATHEIPPTRGNSQRKIAAMRWSTDSIWYHAVYVSGGRVWYTWTEDAGDTWQPEVLISDFHHTASNPCIAVKNEYEPNAASTPAMVYICYVDNSEGAVVVKSKFHSWRPDEWYTLDSIAVADPSNTHPVVAAASYTGMKYCAMVFEGSRELRYSVYCSGFPLLAGHQTNSRQMSYSATFSSRMARCTGRESSNRRVPRSAALLLATTTRAL